MRLFIDLDQHAAIQDFTVAAPASPPQFKSQDTIDFLIYFIQAGIVQDMGASFAMKFAMIKTGDTTNTILAYQTTSTYLTDSNGNVYYQMQVNFNTAQMVTAIGTNSSIACTIELRYQDALAEIIHTLNLAATVFQTIIAETGVTPPNVSTGYPDASTIELLVHKNATSGYAGLDATSHLAGSVIPVDGQTVAIVNSKVASASILATTNANFTTPASGGTVSVTFVSTSNLKANSYVRIPIAGYYIVNSITDATHAVLQNNGDPFNASSGTTITSGTVVLPAQAAAGGGGSAGQNAYTTLSAGFTVPSVGGTVSISVGSTAWMGGNGYGIFVTGAGYYLINSITDATHAVVTNSGSAANQPTGTSVASGGTVSAAGPQGPAGSAGTALAAYDALQSSFVMPNASGNVNIVLGSTAWVGTNQVLYIAGGGYLQVASIINATNLSVTNLGYPGNAAPGATVANGARVSPGGLQGVQGSGGAGLNGYTTLSANFTQPAINAAVTATVGATGWMSSAQILYVGGGGYYSVNSITDSTHVILNNLGYTGNATPGSTVTGSGTQVVSAGGVSGPAGPGAYTTTTAAFTMPAGLTSVTVALVSTAFLLQNGNIYIGGAGYFSVSSVVDSTHILAINLGSPGNVSSGTVIASGAGVTVAGATGPAINTSGGFSTAADAIAPAGTGEVSHIASQSGGVLALKKLKAGTGITLTDQGGSTGDILVTASSGGGGGGLITADVGIQVQEDFVENSTYPRWTLSGNGATPAIGSNVGCDATNKGAGVAVLPPGTASPNRSVVYYGSSMNDAASTNDHYVPGLGILELRFRVWLAAIYSASANYSIVRCGLITDDGTGVIRGGIYFSYDYANGSGNWIAVTASAGTITRNASTIAVVAAQWMNLRIVTDATWANASFYVNGTLAKAVSGFTLPVNPMPITLMHVFGAGSGLTTLYVDYAYMNYSYSRGTW